MVTGDDIAGADNILKKIKDKQKYIYNDLLKGPAGCETELRQPESANPELMPMVTRSFVRYPYPHPILYNYNDSFVAKNPLDPFPDLHPGTTFSSAPLPFQPQASGVNLAAYTAGKGGGDDGINLNQWGVGFCITIRDHLGLPVDQCGTWPTANNAYPDGPTYIPLGSYLNSSAGGQIIPYLENQLGIY